MNKQREGQSPLSAHIITGRSHNLERSNDFLHVKSNTYPKIVSTYLGEKI
tara:strand:+ start:2457 stop:2606 length:150 start_codon:yes stop_codon:yes gene_type:complete